MSALGKLVRELMNQGVEGEALAAVIDRFDEAAAELRRENMAEMIDVVSRKLDERLPPYDPIEHKRALGRARQARLEEKKRQKASESVRTASDLTHTDAKEIPPTPPKETNPIPPLKGGTFPQTSDAADPEKPKQKPISSWVSEIWELTPHRARQRGTRRELETSLRAAERRGRDLEAVKAALEAYYASPDATKNGGEFAKAAHRMVQDDRWEAFADEAAPDGRQEPQDPWPSRLLNFQINGYWNSDWGPKPGKPGYLGPADSLAA